MLHYQLMVIIFSSYFWQQCVAVRDQVILNTVFNVKRTHSKYYWNWKLQKKSKDRGTTFALVGKKKLSGVALSM